MGVAKGVAPADKLDDAIQRVSGIGELLANRALLPGFDDGIATKRKYCCFLH